MNVMELFTKKTNEGLPRPAVYMNGEICGKFKFRFSFLHQLIKFLLLHFQTSLYSFRHLKNLIHIKIGEEKYTNQQLISPIIYTL